MEPSVSANSLQLSPVVSSRRTAASLLPSNELPGRRQSEVFCNVRHMLSYIDQVESENYRHTRAIEDQFQVIKYELFGALQRRGERPSAGGAIDGQPWEPLISDMERDLELNQVAMTGIGRNLARLKERFEEMTGRTSHMSAIAILKDPASTRKRLSLQYDTPRTNRIEYSPESVHNARQSLMASGNSPIEHLFGEPEFETSQRLPRTASSSIISEAKSKGQPGKRNLDKESQDSLQMIIEATEFWRIKHEIGDSQRFVNVLYGLPKGAPTKTEVEEAIGWIDRSHVAVPHKKARRRNAVSTGK